MFNQLTFKHYIKSYLLYVKYIIWYMNPLNAFLGNGDVYKITLVIVLKSFLKSETVLIWQLEWSLFQTITEIFMIIERHCSCFRPIYHASTRRGTENSSLHASFFYKNTLYKNVHDENGKRICLIHCIHSLFFMHTYKTVSYTHLTLPTKA